jgi:hypothetical protein
MRTPLFATTLIAAVALLPTRAAAISPAVKAACRSDYYAHCSGMVVGSGELRSCMRSNLRKLSQGCLRALVDNKEVTQAEINNYARRSKR